MTEREEPLPQEWHEGLLDSSYITYTEGLNLVPGAALEWTGNGDGISSSDIVAGVDDTLSVDVDGTTYTITLTAGHYGNSSLLMSEVNTQLTAGGSPVKMFNFLPPPWNRTETMLRSSVLGADHKISNLSGTAYSLLFLCERDWFTSTMIQGFSDVTQGMTVVSGVNDTLNLLAGGIPYTIKLSQGNYKNEVELTNELNAKLTAAGTGVVVSTYDHLPPRSGKALVFERNGVGVNNLKLVSGNALNQLTLISVSPEVLRPASPAQLLGSADLTEGLTIEYGVNDRLTFSVDGQDYAVRLSAGEYTSDQLRDELNELLTKAHAGIHTELVNDRLSLVHDLSGNGHAISGIGGSAALTLFGEVVRREIQEPEQTIVPIFAMVEKELEKLLAHRDKITLQLGANQGQAIQFSLRQMDTDALRISDITSKTREEAERAIGRIDAAKAKVTSERTKLGALQNTLEFTNERLATYEGNLTASESRIRDADLAQAMMEFTKSNILQQAAQAMLAQANQIPQGVLSLLK